MKKDITLHPDMGEAIMRRLSDFATLPSSGYLAGQAVASAVSELFGDGRAVRYNDVDVFRRQSAIEQEASLGRWKERQAQGQARRAIKTCTFTSMQFDTTYQGLTLVSQSRYRVVGTTRKGLLNEVVCETLTSDVQAFLRTFDLNCVQAGVNLETGKLFWTPEFEAFCRSRQLELVALHTPMHSLIRYFRKRAELDGTYGNDERIIELVGAAHQLVLGVDEHCIDENPQLAWRFGEAYRKRLASVQGQVLEHFELVTETIRGYEVSTLKPRFEAGQDLLDAVDRNFVHTLPVVSRALREKHARGRFERLQHLLGARRDSFTRSLWLSLGESFIKGNVSITQMTKLDRVIAEHGIAHHVQADTLGNTWERFQLVEAEARRRGKWVYGVLENTAESFASAEALKAMLDEQELGLARKFTTALLPELELDGYTCRELVTGLELHDEGASMHHCVGGYITLVEYKQSRIVRLRPGPEASTWLTLQLSFRRGVGYKVAQLTGVANRRATDDEAKLARQYCGLANLANLVGPTLAIRAWRAAPQRSLGFAERAVVVRQKMVDRILNASNGLASRMRLVAHQLDERNGRYVAPDHMPLRFWSLQFRRLVSGQGLQRMRPVPVESDFAGPYANDPDIPY